MAARPRDYVRVAGPDAEDFLQRMLSNDVTAAPCQALLLTPKARLIAPLVVVRREADDFLLLTEPGLGEAVRATLLRARFAAKVEIEPEEHTSVVVFGEDGGIPNHEFGEVRIGAARRRPRADAFRGGARANADRGEGSRLGQGARRLDPPRRGGPRRDAHLVHEGLLSGPGADREAAPPRQGEPLPARHSRSTQREPGDEIRHGEKVVGRVTSAVPGRALGYVRVEVPSEAEIEVGTVRKTARMLGA